MSFKLLSIRNSLRFTSIALLCAATVCATAPRGWYLSGSNAKSYASGVDAQTLYDGHRSVYLKATAPSIDGFGTLMQDFRADQYSGKHIRLSAALKTDGVDEWAGLWMRVDKGTGANPKIVAFDNMQNRAVHGTHDWQSYQVVLDVPADATGVFFGVLLNGPGSVWMSDVKLDAVGLDVPTTGAPFGSNEPRPNAPVNLNFAQ